MIDRNFNSYPGLTERMAQLLITLPPMMKASKVDSDYQPFPLVAYHLYTFQPELYEVAPAKQFSDLTLNAGYIVGLLKDHYAARTVTPHFDYFAVSWPFMLQMFAHDVPVYRITAARETYPLIGKDLLKEEDGANGGLFSLGGLHFQVSNDLQPTEIVAVLHNSDYELLDAPKVFIDTQSIKAKHSYYQSYIDAVQAVRDVPPATGMSIGYISDKLSGLRTIDGVTLVDGDRVLRESEYWASELPESLPEGVPVIKLASVAVPQKVGKRLEELFGNMMVDGSKVQVEGMHFDGTNLNLTYSLA